MSVDAGSAWKPVSGSGTGSTPQASRVIVVVVLGELDLSTAPHARSQVRRGLAEQPERLTVDLSYVTFMGSAGLGVLVDAQDDAHHRGVQLNLTGVQGNRVVLRALQVSGLYELFDVE
jgi:anti-sigma B factor antagonist